MYESRYLLSSSKSGAADIICSLELLKTLNNPFQGTFRGTFPSGVEIVPIQPQNPPILLTAFQYFKRFCDYL